jgi:pimeloyl-ACP methyl ester carboxylesterase
MLRTAQTLCALALALAPALLPPVDARAHDLSLTRRPDTTSTVGVLRVERFGRGPRAMILVAGLGCGSWVWRDTIEAFHDRFTVYAVTLPGANGAPSIAGPQLDRAVASLVALVEGESLARPLVVGHSLGGHLALRLAAEHPTLVGAVVSVDGVPVLPPLASAKSAEERRAMIAPMFARLRSLDDAEYATYQRTVMDAMVTDASVAEAATALVLHSDRASMLAQAEEMAAADLRPLLPKIVVPVTVLVPVPSPSPALPEPMRSMSPEQLETATIATYAALFAGVPRLTLRAVRGSRHFVMLDQPKAFLEALVVAATAAEGAK